MKKGIVPAFATQIRGLSGCAHSMRSTLNPPTITFSTQKSSRVANTLQPKSNTPASGTRFAATSTRALGDRRRPAAAADGVGVRWGIVTGGNDAGSTRRGQGPAGPAAPGDLARVSNVSNNLAVVGLLGSPAATSKSRVLVEYALARLAARGARAGPLRLAGLSRRPALGRGPGPAGAAALAAATRARIVLAGTPRDPAAPTGPR